MALLRLSVRFDRRLKTPVVAFVLSAAIMYFFITLYFSFSSFSKAMTVMDNMQTQAARGR